jgi:hypothetical protein
MLTKVRVEGSVVSLQPRPRAARARMRLVEGGARGS